MKTTNSLSLYQLCFIVCYIILAQNNILAQNRLPTVVSTPPTSPFGPPNQYSRFYHEIKVDDDDPDVRFDVIKLPSWLQTFKAYPKSLFIEGTCEYLETDSIVVSISDSIHTIRYGFEFTVRPLYALPWFQIPHDADAYVDSLFNFPVKAQIGGVDQQLIQLECTSKPDWLTFENGNASDFMLYGKLTGTPSAEGIFNVQLIAKYGLKNPLDENFILNITVKKSNTAVQIISDDNDRIIFDKHSNFIRFASEMQSIELFDVTGRLLISSSHIKELDLTAMPRGILFVKFQNNLGVVYKRKIIKS